MGDWTPGEAELIAATVTAAPTGRGRPWVLELGSGRGAALYERFDSPWRVDPLGRTRLVWCGAAVVNLRLAVRRLGWAFACELFVDDVHPDKVVWLTASGRVAPTSRELGLFHAVFAGPGRAERIDAHTAAVLAQAGRCHGVRVAGSRPGVFEVSAVGDRRVDWVRTGMALQEMALTATARGMAAVVAVEPDGHGAVRVGPVPVTARRGAS